LPWMNSPELDYLFLNGFYNMYNGFQVPLIILMQ